MIKQQSLLSNKVKDSIIEHEDPLITQRTMATTADNYTPRVVTSEICKKYNDVILHGEFCGCKQCRYYNGIEKENIKTIYNTKNLHERKITLILNNENVIENLTNKYNDDITQARNDRRN